MKALLATSLLLSLPAVAAGAGFRSHGFVLPDGAVKVDDDRYRLPQTWEEAKKFYKAVYPPAKYPRHTLHSESQVQALHLRNPSGLEWEGVNLYELPGGEVRVYVLQGREPPAQSPARRRRSKK